MNPFVLGGLFFLVGWVVWYVHYTANEGNPPYRRYVQAAI